jgi:hypothetical protein
MGMYDTFNNPIKVGNIYRDSGDTSNTEDAQVVGTPDGGIGQANGTAQQVTQAMDTAGGSPGVGWVAFAVMVVALYVVVWYAGKREDFALIMPGFLNFMIIGLTAAIWIVGAKTLFTAYPVKHVTAFVHSI